MSDKKSPTIGHYLNAWLTIRKASKSQHTFAASKSAAKAFLRTVGNIPLPTLSEEHFSQFLRALKTYDPKTEQLYATLIYGWFVYLGAKDIRPINLAKLKYARENEQRRPGKRLRDFDRPAIEKLKESLVRVQVGDDLALARALALVTLALDSGLRVSELCRLKVADLDFVSLRGKVVGKRDKQRRFPFTQKSVRAIQEYLALRKRIEPDRGKGLVSADLPVFISHSKRGHKKLSSIDTDTARMDLARIVNMLIGTPEHPITPHVLRHFAGNELRKVTGDIEIVRVILGHENIGTTQGYMHVEDEEALAAYQKYHGDQK